ncbi:MAG TPA: FAD-dependent oxidoreductase [Pirellulales bacterium]|jgi:pyruvate/2-oxoglutarate dehydrogenase complex dihydrolipoamide dehydrogenase (E3) component|nr:FAD-dependent oxidoreductase [Pirellulales bacterium]
MTHIEALELGELPEHLIVLGGGYVGLEIAQAFRCFGSRVTVIERNIALIHREDSDVSKAMQQLFRDEGIEVLTGMTVEQVDGQSGTSVRMRTTRGNIEGTHVLVAGGRTPNTDAIGLEKTGVEVDARGHVKVNERLETTAIGIWAAGDCAGSPYFTHIGEDDFRIVLANLFGGNRTTTGRQVPFCLFTDPELARIGLNEQEAAEHGIRYRLGIAGDERLNFAEMRIGLMIAKIVELLPGGHICWVIRFRKDFVDHAQQQTVVDSHRAD